MLRPPLEPGYPQSQAAATKQASRSGATSLKILKTLGLFLCEAITSRKLISIDDPRFDPMWETCTSLQMPVGIQVADPVAVFRPADHFNERDEELDHHPGWSFQDRGFWQRAIEFSHIVRRPSSLASMWAIILKAWPTSRPAWIAFGI